MATLSAFIRDLHESGRVVVPGDGPAPEPDAPLQAALADAARVACDSAPGSPPAINLAAARWGFFTLFQAARFHSHRDLGPELLARAFADSGPSARDPATIFSVDLGLRHLPTIAAWATASAVDDPLNGHLTALGVEWTLSSVGMPGTAVGDPGPLLVHPSLLALYVDRIIATGDALRCQDPRIRLAVAAALGDHRSPLSRALLESPS